LLVLLRLQLVLIVRLLPLSQQHLVAGQGQSLPQPRIVLLRLLRLLQLLRLLHLLLALLLLPPRQPLGLLLDARHWRRSAHRLSHHLSHLLTHLLGLLPHQPLPPLPFAPLPIPTALLLPPPRGAPLGHVDLGRPDGRDGEGGVG